MMMVVMLMVVMRMVVMMVMMVLMMTMMIMMITPPWPAENGKELRQRRCCDARHSCWTRF